MIQNRRTIEEAAPGALFSFAYPFDLTRRSLSNFARFGWIAPAAMLLVLLLAVMDNQASGEGEPFSWTNGVGAWPSQFIRLLTVALAIAFMLRGEEDLRRNQLRAIAAFHASGWQKGKGPKGKGISDWLHFAIGVRATDLWLEYRWLGRPLAKGKADNHYVRPLFFFTCFFWSWLSAKCRRCRSAASFAMR